MTRSPITTHVLDTTLGRPAKGVPIVLEISPASGAWQELGRGVTNDDGRITDLLSPELKLAPGVYRMTFDTAGYHQRVGQEVFYPAVTIMFELKQPGEHYHIPLLLSPYGYSTYRGS
jgi:5-hydroxyisourate hydrolase